MPCIFYFILFLARIFGSLPLEVGSGVFQSGLNLFFYFFYLLPQSTGKGYVRMRGNTPSGLELGAWRRITERVVTGLTGNGFKVLTMFTCSYL
jgi:hypothetical protein